MKRNQPKTERNALFTVDDCDNLSLGQIWSLYRAHVNPCQVDLLAALGFGRDVIDRAEGMWITTREGRRVLDFTGGTGVLNHGHNHPRILQARRRFQEQNRMEVHKYFFSPYLAALSHDIAALLPDDLDIVYLPNSGAEAIEGALKIAYKAHAGNRSRVLHSDISYHGTLLGAASVSGSKELWFRFPEIPGATPFSYGDIGSVKARIKDSRKADGTSDVYAILIEPMSASTLRTCAPEFLREVRAIADSENIALIFDEVFTGWGKTGKLFHFMHTGVVPDIIVMSKSLGGGKASISAYVARRGLFMKAYGTGSDVTLHTTTYNGFGEEAVTAIEAINIAIEDKYADRAVSIGEQLSAGLTDIKARFPDLVSDVRGTGALQGLRLRSSPEFLSRLASTLPGSIGRERLFLEKAVNAAVLHDLYTREGVLTFIRQNTEVLLMAAPSLIAEESHIELFLRALKGSLSRGFPALVADLVKSKAYSLLAGRL